MSTLKTLLRMISDAGDAAALDVGTTAGTVAAGDDSRLLDIASQAEAEAGAINTKTMTPLRVAQAIAALVEASETGFSTGDVKLTLKNVADSGWIMANDGTIGSASSGAGFAHADAEDLYLLIWNNVSNTYAAVSGGRGASAAADWAANKAMALTKMLGRALAVSGSGAGLTARTLGQTTGTETHVLSTAEMPSHTHSGYYEDVTPTNAGYTVGAELAVQTVTGVPASTATGSAGSGNAHANMQPTSFLNVMIKL
jgi:hypothetical protein